MGHDLNYRQVAPPKSYIAVNPDYRDRAKQLADYLIHLDHNDKEYAEYFWWKSHYTVNHHRVGWKKAWCGMCAALNAVSGPKPSQVDDIKTWWVVQSECHEK